MKQSIKFALLVATMCGAGFAQDSSTQAATQSSSPSPVAYVYVSSGTSSGNYKINEYSAASNGALTPVPGSPISTNNVSDMALNGKWLFGTNGTDIYSFSIASNGALKQVSSINAQKYNAYDSGGPGALFLDHSGANLYDFDVNGDGTGNNEYQSFDINQDTGVLSYTGTTIDSADFETALSFIGNNVDAYGAGCYHGDQSIYGFSRGGSGTLTELSTTPPIPAGPKGSVYCPYLAAADPTNHLAITLTPTNDGFSPTGPTQLGVYTASSTGSLTTTSTDTNMPQIKVGNVYDIWMSPAGNLLAVAGSKGLQLFHFNGANPITTYTGPITVNAITQMFWDNNNHLYAVSPAAGKLFVFTATPTSYRQAPGSPYSITGAQNVIVLPK